MKLINLGKNLGFVLMGVFAFSTIVICQAPVPQETPQKRDRVTKDEPKTDTATASDTNKTTPDATPPVAEVKSTDIAKNTGGTDSKGAPDKMPQDDLSDEEAAIRPVYDNYLKEYSLGPEDIISVEVFGQPNYSKSGITIPPTAVISYPLIPGGIFVAGKSTEQIAKEIAKKLDEYIIDPQVTVTLEKVGSARFAILGKVGAPGVRLMTRKYSLYEALVESGGLAQDGDKKRVMLLRRSSQGGYSQTIYNLDELIAGKKEMPYLAPGDQVIVPEKKWSMTKILDIVGRLSAARILFGSPF